MTTHGFCSYWMILGYLCCACRSQVLFPFFLLNQLIDHFTDVWVVAWPLNKSETGGGFLVSKENVILLLWESETKIWFYQLS